MKAFVKKIARVFLGQYEIYRIYCSLKPTKTFLSVKEVNSTDLERSSDAGLRQLAHYSVEGSFTFGLYEDELLVCGVCYWLDQLYNERRGFIKLPQGAAKLVQVTTAGTHQGQGLASKIIKTSTDVMYKKGYWPLYARVWLGHTASEKAFLKAGWKKTGTVFSFYFLGKKRQISLVRT